MKHTHVFRTLLISYLISHLSYLSSAALQLKNSPMALPPFTFVGRVTDYDHVAYDADQVVTVRAYAQDGTELAKAKTYFARDSFYNFKIDIPLASAESEGRAKTGDKVKLVFTDPEGRIFDGVVPEDNAVVGNPGEYRRISVMLATDEDNDGVSDEYVYYNWWNLMNMGLDWTDFDAEADYDGDGQNNRSEFIAGTSMFDDKDVFNVRALNVSNQVDWVSVGFLAKNGRAYTVLTSDSLDDGKQWKLGTFRYQDNNAALEDARLMTGGSETGWRWFFLPKDLNRRFWRIEVE